MQIQEISKHTGQLRCEFIYPKHHLKLTNEACQHSHVTLTQYPPKLTSKRDPQVHPTVTNGSYNMCTAKAERSTYTYESVHKQQSATFGSGFSSGQSKDLACMQHSDKWFFFLHALQFNNNHIISL